MWNWQESDWPHFTYKTDVLTDLEKQFLLETGFLLGMYTHLDNEDQQEIRIELMTTEALKTSEIEGEILDRDSVQASLRRSFGLQVDNRKIEAAEYGIAQMMVQLHQEYAAPLSHEMLFQWHRLLMNGRQDLEQIGAYRTHTEPMQVVSGKIYDPKVHFEAPPSHTMPDEMEQFIEWFNKTAPNKEEALPPCIRAGVAHLYFVSIHPFEDGNGRIGRALAEKVIAQYTEHPTLLSLSYTIEKHKKDYYTHLEQANKGNEITAWLQYFSHTIINAQQNSKDRLLFLIGKTKLYAKLRGQLNERQAKVLTRLFLEGIDGFTGGLSAKNYQRIARTSAATATRDLQDLVNKGALTAKGKLKHTRYYLKLDS